MNQNQAIEFIFSYSSTVKNPLLSRSALLNADSDIPDWFASWRLICPLPSRSTTVNAGLASFWVKRGAEETNAAKTAIERNFMNAWDEEGEGVLILDFKTDFIQYKQNDHNLGTIDKKQKPLDWNKKREIKAKDK